jgi:hypothetical protein
MLISLFLDVYIYIGMIGLGFNLFFCAIFVLQIIKFVSFKFQLSSCFSFSRIEADRQIRIW